MNWQRVTKKDKCPVCGHDSWCIYTEGVAICMRVESKRPKDFASGEKGWLHRINECSPLSRHTTYKEPSNPTPTIDCRKLLSGWDRPEHAQQIQALAHALGVSCGSLTALSCCWAREHRAWAFPMKDAYENVVGIRLRAINGDKFAVRGSHTGLFIPMVKHTNTVMVLEGPSDTAAALDLGYYAVGKPSATGGALQLKQFVIRRRIRRVVIVCDNDEVGIRGGRTLTEMLTVPCALVVLPCKDVRSFLNLGGSRQMLEARINQSVWQNT